MSEMTLQCNSLAVAESTARVELAVCRPTRASLRRLSLECAILVILIGVGRLTAYLFGWNAGQLDSLAR
jgi:hypothetical protein